MAFSLQVVFDCHDPDALSKFYAEALHYKPQDPPRGYASWEAFLEAHGVPESDWNLASAIVDPQGKGPRIYFQRMDTPKFGKNRLHIDMNVSARTPIPLHERKGEVEREVARLVGLGATRDHDVEEAGEFWVVMLDPEGNEFCVQ